MERITELFSNANMESRTGLFSNAVIWFGVAVSVSEIEAGIQLASSSPIDSIWVPLILGHIIGGILLFFTGLIGAQVRLNAMETIKSTFGNLGSKFFSSLNVFQLIAWVAVLNAQGAAAMMGLNLPISFPITCVILSLIIAIWVYVGLKRLSKLTTIVMIVLTILLAILSIKLLGINASSILPVQAANSGTLSFWNIFEISIAMPISWLPVISDYTKDVENPINGTLISAVAYTIASLWMYFLGMAIVGIGTTSIANSILVAGLGAQGVLILVLSTVTSNFVAANSAGESAKAIYSRIDPKIAGVIVSALSCILAISGIMDHYIGFLYLIASVFAPMAAVLMISFYLSKKDDENPNSTILSKEDNENPNSTILSKEENENPNSTILSKEENENQKIEYHSKEDNTNPKIWYWNLFAWFAGFIVYQMTVNLDSIFLGPTLLAIITSAILAYIGVLANKKSYNA